MIDGAIVNVLDFGAVGDGVADDTAAIQAAVNSIVQGTVYFPNGTFKITNTINIDASTKYSLNLKGNGLASLLKYDGITPNIPMVYYFGGSNSNFATVENLQFFNNYRTGDTILNGVVGLRIGRKDAAVVNGNEGTCNMTVRKCQIQYCDIGIEIYSESDQVTIEECYVFVWTGYAILCLKNPLVVSGTGSASVRVQKNHLIGGQAGSWAVKIKGENSSVVDNVIQTAVGGDGVWIFESKAFRVSSNYTESTAGVSNFVYVENGALGYIGENTIGGYSAANIIEIDSNSFGINIGPNFYATAGGFPAYLILVDVAATGINIIGDQYQTSVGGGGISGPINFQINSTGNLTSFASVKSPLITTENSFINIIGASNTTLFTAVANGCYLVNVSQEQEDYAATAIVTVIGNTATVNVNTLYSTNANLSITATGLAIKANNGIGATRTVFYGFIRIA